MYIFIICIRINAYDSSLKHDWVGATRSRYAREARGRAIQGFEL